ncbi:MAG: AarF/ABC1/UbiB kinase family protein [Verrucomicrobiae bacterium]|nr:AarF/ABC1/UbiB kinase family protein [Verrucomicrobiae bacterium]
MIVDTFKTAAGIYERLPRYREILEVLFKYGFGDALRLVHLQGLLDIHDHFAADNTAAFYNKSMPERLRLALQELGPTFVKLGQILSSRRDLINEEFYHELCLLQDQVPPFDAKLAREIIERELGHPIDKLFRSFEEKPIGGASIAQVHRAVLKSGQTVAVKVQRPDIQAKIEMDLSILKRLAYLVERNVPEMAVLNPVGIVNEFATSLLKEIDFTIEAQHMERFREQFKSNPDIRVPEVFPECSTERVLTMEFFSGTRIDDVEALKKAGIEPVALSEKVSQLIFSQVFEFGFFHGDPHPGNMTVLPGAVVGLYDYGMMGKLSLPFRENIASLVMGLATKQSDIVLGSVLGMSEEGYVEHWKELQTDIEEFSESHLDKPLKDLKIGFVLERLLDLLMKHHLRMKPGFYLGIKALTQVEAVGVKLNPDLNFVKLGQPYATAIMAGKFDPRRMGKTLMKSLSEFVGVLEFLPGEFRELVAKIRAGKFTVPIEHRVNPEGFDPIRTTLNHIANRLTDAILAASILLASSILILAKMPPVFMGVPVVGVLGLLLGLYMTLRIIISTMRHGGL